LPSILKFVQVPHHGSRHNVSTSVIDRILGPRKTTNDGLTNKIAFVSAGRDSKTHPRKMVVNAFIRRGALVIATQGQSKCYREGMPQRDGWIDATPLSFSNVGESWE
jgi:beta-lactamase superfamily II metal-dependent hydrolase